MIQKDISTRELWARLFKATTVSEFLGECDEHSLPSFADYVSQLADERGMRHEAVINAAGIERTFGYRLLNGTRNPSRDTVIQMAFGLRLDCDQAQQLLKVARMSALHPKVKRDAVIAFCLHEGLSLMDAQQALYNANLPLLGGVRRA